MKLRRLLLPALAPLMLAACATTGTTTPAEQAGLRGPAASSDVEFGQDEAVSSYGLYLAGRGAMSNGDNALATRYFERARASGLEELERRKQSQPEVVLPFVGQGPSL